MTELTILHNISVLPAFDLAVIAISAGLFLAGLKREIKGITIFLQVAIVLIKITKHYYSTHPEAEKMMSKKYIAILDKIYNKFLRNHDTKLLSTGESKAKG